MSTEIELTKASAPASNGKLEAVALSVLAEGDSFRGSIQMNGDGQVLGAFRGEIVCEGELLIGPQAQVDANIRALRVVIAGIVRGNVVATGRLKLASSGRLEGDARVGALVVQEGGVHHGVIRVHPEGIPAETEVIVVQEDEIEMAPAALPQAAGSPLGASVDRVKKFWGELF